MPTGSRTRSPRRAMTLTVTVTAAVALLAGAVLFPSGSGNPPAAHADTTAGQDVALQGVATAASTYPDATFDVAHVNDGDPTTRWGSAYNHTNPNIVHDPTNDWVQIQLAKAYPIDHVVLTWEAAYAASYVIQGSTDGSNWTDLKSVTDGAGGTETIQLSTTTAYSYVRMQGRKTATKYGYSLWSFEVWDGPQATPPSTGGIVPQPVDQQALTGDPFVLRSDARIVAASSEATAVADDLATTLRASTGYALPVTTGAAEAGDIDLTIGDPKTTAATDYAKAEAYRLHVDEHTVALTASTAHGLYDGVQSLLQLFPSWVYSTTAHDVDWTVAATDVQDYPRFAQRGLMIDPARNFIDVAGVKKIIDDLAMVKGDRLHMHLTDDQGWRIQIKKYPNLTAHGGTGSIKGGISGFYTQDDFAQIVAYAQAHFIQVIPEIDMPGHMTAAISSYPDLSCSGDPIDMITTNATGTVPLCVSKPSTYDFVTDVIDEVAAISPSPYIHIGGDEVSGMTDADYSTFVQKVETIVKDAGKTPIGWTPIPKASASASTVYQYWADRNNSTTSAWFAGDRPVMLSPTSVAYLDYGFAPGQRIDWKYTNHDTRQNYTWDPSSVVDETTGKNLTTNYGLQQQNVQGVEGAIWGETMLRGLPDVEFSVWPRLAGLMEKAWTPQTESGDFSTYSYRLGQLGAKWQAAGTNFWADPDVPWVTSAAGDDIAQHSPSGFSGTVATIASPNVTIAKLDATIDWGDGSPSTTGTVSGTDAAADTSASRSASLFPVSGQHAYTTAGTFHGTVTVDRPGGDPITVDFTATVGTDGVTADPHDVAALQSAIDDARQLADGTATGTRPGDAPPAAKDAFAAAIAAADAVATDAKASQADVAKATSDLGTAVTTFRAAIIGAPTSSFTLTVNGHTPKTLAFDTPTVFTVGNLAPGSTVTLTLHSDPITLGTAKAGHDGTARIVGTVPAGTTLGTHDLVVDGVHPGGATDEAAFAIRLVAASSPSAAPPAGTSQSDGLANTGSDVVLGLLAALLTLATGAAALTIAFRRRRWAQR